MTSDPAAEDFQPRLRAAVRDIVQAYLTQASAGPLPTAVLDKLLFDGTHAVTRTLMHFSRDQRAALLPSVVNLLLAAFLEELETLRAQGGKPGGPARASQHGEGAP